MSGDIPRPRFFGPMLIVRDVEASLRFYRDVLQLEGDGASPYAEFTTSGSSTLVVLDGRFWGAVGGPSLDATSTAPRDGVVLAIKVPVVDQEYDRLVRSGLSIHSSPTDRPQMGLRNLILRDPDGNIVELYSDLARPTPQK
jgi:catechol 2,3-dioxygenase-like lactoylglutathione lyase family enzyme